jgi:hypothetical protein
MDYLTGVPTDYGISILKAKLYEKIKRFNLIDSLGEKYFTDTVHRVYFDSEGVLSVTVIIPKDQHFTLWNKYIELTDEEERVIISLQTPEIQFVRGVGGEIQIKLPVSGEVGDVIFKKDEYLTEYEAQEMFLEPILNLWALNSTIQQSILKREIEEIGG